VNGPRRGRERRGRTSCRRASQPPRQFLGVNESARRADSSRRAPASRLAFILGEASPSCRVSPAERSPTRWSILHHSEEGGGGRRRRRKRNALQVDSSTRQYSSLSGPHRGGGKLQPRGMREEDAFIPHLCKQSAPWTHPSRKFRRKTRPSSIQSRRTWCAAGASDASAREA